MEFSKYTSIKNSYDKKTVSKIENYVGEKTTYIALEKVHGANFSIYVNIHTMEVRFGKRSGFLGDSSFYGHTNLKADLTEKAKKLAALLRGQANTITIDGEICGGGYSGVTKEGHKKVQKEVQYHTENTFIGFDLRLDDQFVPTFKALRLLEDAGFYVAPVIDVQDSLSKILEVDVEFITKVPEIFNLEEIEGNIAEGVVIRPLYEEVTLPNGNRAVLKKKSAKFSEKKQNKDKPREDANLSENMKGIFEDVSTYITENRLSNVISKIGAITSKDFGKVVGLLIQDAIEDYQFEVMNNGSLKEFVGDEWKAFNKELKFISSNILRDNISNYLEV